VYLSDEFVVIVRKRCEFYITNVKKIPFNSKQKSSLIPHKVTNIQDYFFGEIMGGLRDGLTLTFKNMYDKPFSDDEANDLLNLIIEYQDLIGKHIYE